MTFENFGEVFKKTWFDWFYALNTKSIGWWILIFKYVIYERVQNKSSSLQESFYFVLVCLLWFRIPFVIRKKIINLWKTFIQNPHLFADGVLC